MAASQFAILVAAISQVSIKAKDLSQRGRRCSTDRADRHRHRHRCRPSPWRGAAFLSTVDTPINLGLTAPPVRSTWLLTGGAGTAWLQPGFSGSGLDPGRQPGCAQRPGSSGTKGLETTGGGRWNYRDPSRTGAGGGIILIRFCAFDRSGIRGLPHTGGRTLPMNRELSRPRRHHLGVACQQARCAVPASWPGGPGGLPEISDRRSLNMALAAYNRSYFLRRPIDPPQPPGHQIRPGHVPIDLVPVWPAGIRSAADRPGRELISAHCAHRLSR